MTMKVKRINSHVVKPRVVFDSDAFLAGYKGIIYPRDTNGTWHMWNDECLGYVDTGIRFCSDGVGGHIPKGV